MENNKMSINRALAELKLLDKRITEKTRSKFINFYVGKKPPIGYKSNEEFIEEAKSNFQSVKDLISRRNKIKKAIVASNAITVVNIAGKEMTVAEAIERKNSIEYEKNLLQNLRKNNEEITYYYENQMREMEQRIDDQIDDINRRDGKVSEDERLDIERTTKNRYEPHILDPIDIKKQIELLAEEINNFEMEVDFVLTESNAKTEIIID